MKTATLALLVLTFALSACANTRYGVQQDARRTGEKIQQIGQIITEP